MVVARRSRGFTLLEVLIAVILVGVSIAALVAANTSIAVILVGVSIAALVAANTSFTLANGTGADISTAEFLVEQIRELTAMLPAMDPDTTSPTFGLEEAALAAYDDVDDFDNFTFSPPIGADRIVLSDLS